MNDDIPNLKCYHFSTSNNLIRWVNSYTYIIDIKSITYNTDLKQYVIFFREIKRNDEI